MYRVEIKQENVTKLSNGESYSHTDTVDLDIKSIEDIETIIGLFINDNTKITISKGGN